MRETWYVLEDGNVVDPNECTTDGAGKLLHKGGAAVAMRGDVPSTSGVDADKERAKNRPPKEDHPKPDPKSKDMKPEDDKPGYKTREVKGK